MLNNRKSHVLSFTQANTGFTAIEVLVVLLIIGILTAVAVPNWLTFTNQRRVNAVNDAVLRALQEVQREAIQKKLDYSISFKTEDTVPKVAIHLAKTIPTNWKNLGEGLELKPGQVLLGTNLVDENTADTSLSYDLTTPKTITFNYTGNLPFSANLGSKGLIVSVATPQSSNSTQAIDTTKRCVKVRTLLGTIQLGRRNECDSQ